MRPNVLAIFSVVALAAAAAFAIQQSPNFTSQTTGVNILTSDSPDYQIVVVPLPYREENRIIQAPVPAPMIATAWADQVEGLDKPAEGASTPAPDDHMGSMPMEASHSETAGVAPPQTTTQTTVPPMESSRAVPPQEPVGSASRGR
jgi:hypothetical protein